MEHSTNSPLVKMSLTLDVWQFLLRGIGDPDAPVGIVQSLVYKFYNFEAPQI